MILWALISNASVQQYPTQQYRVFHRFSNQPSLVDNCQMDTGSTSTDNLIESLTNTLALLNQSFKAHLLQTINSERLLMQGTKLQFKMTELLFRMSDNTMNRHIAQEFHNQSRPQDSDYFKDKMLLMNAHENGVVLDEEQLLINVMHSKLWIYEAPSTQTMFKRQIFSSEYPIYDESGAIIMTQYSV
ncbi:hypothetical protein Tco_0534741 [Tanacetum coccineum]